MEPVHVWKNKLRFQCPFLECKVIHTFWVLRMYPEACFSPLKAGISIHMGAVFHMHCHSIKKKKKRSSPSFDVGRCMVRVRNRARVQQLFLDGQMWRLSVVWTWETFESSFKTWWEETISLAHLFQSPTGRVLRDCYIERQGSLKRKELGTNHLRLKKKIRKWK